MKDLGGIRWQRQQRERTGFWGWSWVGTVQEIFPVNSQSKYIISNWRSSMEKELNVQANIKTRNWQTTGQGKENTNQTD